TRMAPATISAISGLDQKSLTTIARLGPNIVRADGSVNMNAIATLGGVDQATINTLNALDRNALGTISKLGTNALTSISGMDPAVMRTLSSLSTGDLSSLNRLSSQAINSLTNAGTGAVSTLTGLSPGTLTALAQMDSRSIAALSRMGTGAISSISGLDVGTLNALSRLDANSLSSLTRLNAGTLSSLTGLDARTLTSLSRLDASSLASLANLSPGTLSQLSSLGTSGLASLGALSPSALSSLSSVTSGNWLSTLGLSSTGGGAGSGNNNKVNLNCDMRYRNQVVTCDAKTASDVIGTRPSCPKKPMPMIDTPKKAYPLWYTPFLYVYPTDPDEDAAKRIPYSGPYALGTPGDTSRTFQLFGPSATGTKRLSECKTQIKMPSDPSNASETAKYIRLQADNCTNQYILYDAIYPFQKANTRVLSFDDPNNPAARVDLRGECQPLQTFRETENEYAAGEYLEVAWKKLLQDPDYRKSTPGWLRNIPCFRQYGVDNYICDHEPHLPSGVTLENPIAPPDPFPEVLSSAISTVPYEMVVDPTHPFSPRWDFLITDRDYSKYNAASSLSAVAVAVQFFLDQYLSETKDAVFCAGIKEARNESDDRKKADLEVKVDVLSFRRSAFESALTQRAGYNFVCKTHQALWPSGTDAALLVAMASYCWTITGYSIAPPYVYGRDQDCWKCYGLDGKVDDENDHPPCTVNYLGKDQKMKLSSNRSIWFPGLFNEFSQSPLCGTKMEKVCSDLRKPFTPLNKLKMRYHHPKDDDDTNNDNIVLWADAERTDPDGALEGFSFRDYFGNHMPYPRVWDIGQSLQKTASADLNNQPPLDVTGQWTSIVGIGRESASRAASDAAGADADGNKPFDKFKDERCKAQGWGDKVFGVPIPVTNFGGTFIELPDPVSSWTELKLYQTRTARTLSLSCIGRYEKVFKPGSAENLMLLASGADWQKLVISKCDRDPANKGTFSRCDYMTLHQFVENGSPADSESTVYLKQGMNEGWPNSWRGYIASERTDDKFPKFGSTNTNTITGLDQSEPGDIILLPTGHSKSISAGFGVLEPGLAKLALILETRLPNNSDCEDKENCYVRVLEPDDGKWPDSCGTTDTWGEMKSRYYFRPGSFPKEAEEEYQRIYAKQTGAPPASINASDATGGCSETKLSHCEQGEWDNLSLYRIRNDVRDGCVNKKKSSECEKDQ
ncbi:MAG: hypothetical protein ACOYNL_10025, partial [Rickettsiales bacterium]